MAKSEFWQYSKDVVDCFRCGIVSPQKNMIDCDNNMWACADEAWCHNYRREKEREAKSSMEEPGAVSGEGARGKEDFPGRRLRGKRR